MLNKNEPNLILSEEAHNKVRFFLCLCCRLTFKENPRFCKNPTII